MSQPKRYIRSYSTITISQFYEYYQLGKFNFNPSYQREGGIWKDSDKSYLIDTIFKNFPMPSVFLEQKIENGKTFYDVIDGKQRLTTIIGFIENKVSLPKNFDNDEYGYSKLNGKSMCEVNDLAVEDDVVREYVDIFWGYKIGVEYIEKPNKNIVQGIFDRLNRNGVRLNPAELRKAKYNDTDIYKAIFKVVNSKLYNETLSIENDKRQRNDNFCAEIFILVNSNKITSGGASTIEKHFKILSEYSKDSIETLIQNVEQTLHYFKELNVKIDEFNLKKETHLYSLIYLANYIRINNYNPKDFTDKLNNFYRELREEKDFADNQDLQTYYAATQSGSKSVMSRKNRINALFNMLGLKLIEQ